MAQQIETVIVGGGQAGLAMSHFLTERGQPHTIFERHRIAERWRTERWNSLAFQMPNWSLSLPGMDYDGDDPDGFAHQSDILRFIEDYATRIAAPVQTGVEVLALGQLAPDQFVLETSAGEVSARNVIIATGPFHQPAIPALAKVLPPSIFQVDATRYRSPEQLPAGAVLVVGSGSSGTQIADELLRAGRKVFLSVGRHRYAPRRYLGRDVIWWLIRLGRFDVPIDSFPGRNFPPPTVMTGVDGGYDLYPRALAEMGAVLLGRLRGYANGCLEIGDTVNAVLDAADQSCAEFIAAANGLAATLAMPLSDAPLPRNSVPVAPIGSVDLQEADIGSVVWATGYRFNFNWVKLPVLDDAGAPVQQRGVTGCPGIYFLGLHWMHTFRSGLLSYVGQDAAFVADHLVQHRRT